jgi:hypothetical protein
MRLAVIDEMTGVSALQRSADVRRCRVKSSLLRALASRCSVHDTGNVIALHAHSALATAIRH